MGRVARKAVPNLEGMLAQPEYEAPINATPEQLAKVKKGRASLPAFLSGSTISIRASTSNPLWKPSGRGSPGTS